MNRGMEYDNEISKLKMGGLMSCSSKCTLKKNMLNDHLYLIVTANIIICHPGHPYPFLSLPGDFWQRIKRAHALVRVYQISMVVDIAGGLQKNLLTQ